MKRKVRTRKIGYSEKTKRRVWPWVLEEHRWDEDSGEHGVGGYVWVTLDCYANPLEAFTQMVRITVSLNMMTKQQRQECGGHRPMRVWHRILDLPVLWPAEDAIVPGIRAGKFTYFTSKGVSEARDVA